MYKKWYKKYQIMCNSTIVRTMYSKNKAIEYAQIYGTNLFTGHRHVEVVDVETGEVIFNT